MDILTQHLVTIFIGLTIGIVVKIIFDWLKNKRDVISPEKILDQLKTIHKESALMAEIKQKVDQTLNVSLQNQENMTNIFIALNKMITYQEQQTKLQETTNNILEKIRVSKARDRSL